MRSKEIRSLPTVSGLTSRREVLRRGAIVAAVSAIAPVWTRRARAATAAAPFDYYIATNGSDSNPGTLAQPWAITSLNRRNSNNPKMKSKRVGIMPGTYSVYSMWSSGTYTYQDPILNVPGGTSSAWSFLGASDSSGNQTIGGVHITASPSGTPGGGLPGNSSQGIAIVGQWYGDGVGYAQVDGLVVSDSQGLIVSFYGAAAGGGGGPSFRITNCEVYNCGGHEGGNPGAVWFAWASNCLCQNCIIHDVTVSAGGADGHNFAGIFTEMCENNIYEYNTIYNCNCGIYDKNTSNGGHTYRYNYIEVNGSSPYSCLMDCCGGTAGQTRAVHNNILVLAASTSAERWIWQGICTDVPPGPNPLESMQFYNNTCYVLSGGGFQGGVGYQSAGAGSVTHYNNIYVSTASGNYDTISFNTLSSAIAISDYNAYVGGCGNTLGRGTSGAPSNTYELANWQSNFSLDAHSFAQASASGVFASPGAAQNPNGYKLAADSPCSGRGSTTGTSGGSTCDMGAWGGTDVNTGGAVTRIGCNLAAPVGQTTSPPDAPVLSVS